MSQSDTAIMSFRSDCYYGSLYKENGEWCVFINDRYARTFIKHFVKRFKHKAAALDCYNYYKSFH